MICVGWKQSESNGIMSSNNSNLINLAHTQADWLSHANTILAHYGENWIYIQYTSNIWQMTSRSSCDSSPSSNLIIARMGETVVEKIWKVVCSRQSKNGNNIGDDIRDDIRDDYNSRGK